MYNLASFFYGERMSCYVYLHRKKSDGRIFYIGKGQGKRAWKKSQRSDWWKRVEAKHGRTVEIVLRGLTDEQAFELEKGLVEWVGLENLCNLREGGEGGFAASEEVKAAISRANKGRVFSEETREKMRKAATGKRHSEETKEKLREHRMRQVMPEFTEERKAAIAERMRGRFVSAETRQRISESKTGKTGFKWTQEMKDRLSDAMKGRPVSEEAKRKIGDANRGRKHTEEAKAKLKISNGRLNMARRKPIECSNGMVFSFSGDAQDWLRSNGFPTAQRTNVVSCCKGKLKTAYGFVWRYHETS